MFIQTIEYIGYKALVKEKKTKRKEEDDDDDDDVNN